MTIQEFINKYEFHDSLIDTVAFDGESNKVILHIDFAYWKQEWYIENMPETDKLIVIFDGVCSIVCPNDVSWEQISIIQASLEGDSIKFALMNDITNDYLEIIIKCESVTIEYYENNQY